MRMRITAPPDEDIVELAATEFAGAVRDAYRRGADRARPAGGGR